MLDLLISRFSNSSRARHIAKTITWRIVGTVDTIMLAWWLSGDPFTGMKIGGAEVVTKMILYYFHERTWYKIDFGLRARRMRKSREVEIRNSKSENSTPSTLDPRPSTSNIISQAYSISHKDRAERFGQTGKVLWFTGLSGSGKSTIANLVDQKLHELGHRSYVLDGDNIRLGLNKGLTFSDADRKENIRRIAEVAKLFADANIYVLTAFISPFREDRIQAKQIIGEEHFIEVFIDTPLEECEKRDVKGLYKKARNGEIPNFTGIDSPYEAPNNPDLIIKTMEEEAGEAVGKIVDTILELKAESRKPN